MGNKKCQAICSSSIGSSFYSILFYSILFYSIPYYICYICFILFHSYFALYDLIYTKQSFHPILQKFILATKSHSYPNPFFLSSTFANIPNRNEQLAPSYIPLLSMWLWRRRLSRLIQRRLYLLPSYL